MGRGGVAFIRAAAFIRINVIIWYEIIYDRDWRESTYIMNIHKYLTGRFHFLVSSVIKLAQLMAGSQELVKSEIKSLKGRFLS